ncbi:TlpA disulfide reductase family protein [Lysinibacter sp. HNR]|uniref:TlpA family protein disulfide reductase n=1 Tax=Lysinibacter sp. HNR TaxID=3031408 RepID=UPI002434933D|nr:TlpA disulfide reductase family protein [Lysinibacter sp. HNR]WGD37794.1 TlpA disulfide reductase family protein [Lysinibacter sp. HNR]
MSSFGGNMKGLGTQKFQRIRRVGAILLVAGVLAGCSNDPLAEQWSAGDNKGYISGDGTTTEVPVEEREAAVVFSGTIEDGSTVSSEEFLGSVTVVNFWYAGCAPCRVEAPDLQALNTEFADQGVKFLGVNTRDQAAQATQFAEEFGITYPSIIDTPNGRAVQRAFASSIPLNAVPTTLVVDREGRVASRILGQLPDAAILSTLISDTLAEK